MKMQKRVSSLQEALAADGIDGAVFATSAAVQYLLDAGKLYFWQRTSATGGLSENRPETHFQGQPDMVLYIPKNDEPVLFLTPHRAKAMEAVNIKKVVTFFATLGEEVSAKLDGKKLAYGEACAPYLKAMIEEAGIEPVFGEMYTDRLRCIKDEDEIALMRRLAKFTDDAMLHTTKFLRPGITSYEVEQILAKYGSDNGATDLSFSPACILIKTGADGSDDLYGHPINQPMVEGTGIGFDFGFVIDGYCSDYGRSFYSGKPSDLLKDGYKALHDAQLAYIASIRPGMKMDSCFADIKKHMDGSSYGKYLRKAGDLDIMGHQIGIEVHERPWLHNSQEAVFMPGMVMCIEPKLWVQGHAYFRCEDMVLITENGAESLTVFDRDMLELPV